MKLKISILFFFGLAFLNSANAQDNAKYDDRWWQSASVDKRDGFVSGYLDCYIWDVKGKRIPGGSIKQITNRVTNHISRTETVANVLRGTLATEVKSVNGKPHGDYDGDFWRQSSADERDGFVRGNLECKEEEWHRLYGKSADVECRA